MAQERIGSVMGFLPTTPTNGASTLALNAAATWMAYSFVQDGSKTINKLAAFTSAINGTQANISVSAEIYSDSSGNPGTSLAGPVTLTNLAAGWWEWAGFTYATTAGTRYWIVTKNTAGAPATDYPTFRHGGLNTSPFETNGGLHLWGWTKKQSADSGATWATTAVNATFGYRIEYSDATYDGIPCSHLTGAAAAAGVYGTREEGVLITTPADVKLRIRGAVGVVTKTGTPTGNLQFRLYNGTTLLATSTPIPPGNVSNAYVYAYFATTQVVNPGTSLRIMYSETAQSDTSANRYAPFTYTVQDSAASRGLLPWSIQRTYTEDGTVGTPTFSELNTQILPIGIILDTDDEFDASGAGGGILIHTGMQGGFRG